MTSREWEGMGQVWHREGKIQLVLPRTALRLGYGQRLQIVIIEQGQQFYLAALKGEKSEQCSLTGARERFSALIANGG